MKKVIAVMCMVAALGLVLAGCEKKEKPATPVKTAKPVTTAPKTVKPAAAEKQKTAQQTAEQAAGQAKDAAAKVAQDANQATAAAAAQKAPETPANK